MTTTTYQLSDRILGRKERRQLSETEFCRFYECCADGLRAYVIRVSGNATLGEDIFQETCYRLLRTKLPEMDGNQLKSYAYRTATRLVYDSWREIRKEGSEDLTEPLQAGPDTSELCHDVRKLFARLNARQRALLWLAYVEGCDHREIAERLGLGRASIRVLLFRARCKFSRILQNEGMQLEDLV